MTVEDGNKQLIWGKVQKPRRFRARMELQLQAKVESWLGEGNVGTGLVWLTRAAALGCARLLWGHLTRRVHGACI